MSINILMVSNKLVYWVWSHRLLELEEYGCTRRAIASCLRKMQHFLPEVRCPLSRKCPLLEEVIWAYRCLEEVSPIINEHFYPLLFSYEYFWIVLLFALKLINIHMKVTVLKLLFIASWQDLNLWAIFEIQC